MLCMKNDPMAVPAVRPMSGQMMQDQQLMQERQMARGGRMLTGRNGRMIPADSPWAGEVTMPGTPDVISFDDPEAIRENQTDMSGMSRRDMGLARVQGQELDMSNDLPGSVIGAPQSTEEAYLGSLKAMLRRNVGNYMVATFLVGTQNMVSWEGILYDVGNDYLTIYQEARNRYIVSDYYSLKFMEFYDTERQARCAELLAADGWEDRTR